VESRQRLLELKLDSAVDRCEALRVFIDNFLARSYTSPGTPKLLLAINRAVDELASYLRAARTDPDLLLLSEQELETSVQRKTSLVPILHQLLEMVDRSDVSSVRPELLASLRRRVRLHFSRAEVILVSKIHLNYSVVEIRQPLEGILGQYGIALPPDFPDQLFLATIPAVEHDQALLHCILGHEIGHTLYESANLEGKILPIQIDESHLRQLRAGIAKGDGVDVGDEPPQPPDEISFRRAITEGVNTTVTNWIKELASDVFGLITFGPAFLFAFLRFTAAYQRLDAAAETHPSGRLRLRLQFRLLDRIYSTNAFSTTTESFLADWRKIAQSPPSQAPDVIVDLALKSISDEVLDRILGSVLASLPSDLVYGPERYRRAVTELVDLINAHVPPSEVLRVGTRTYEQTDPVDILNAGWETLLGGCVRFKEGLRTSSDAEVQMKLNELLMKAIELWDARLTWEEAVASVA
jgi:hypothetical protein